MKKLLLCYNKADFDRLSGDPNFSYISICGTIDEEETHKLDEDFYDVLNLNFDDIAEDEMPWRNYNLSGLSDRDAERIVRFIEERKNRNFMIHCSAGQSRSQAVVRYILDTYGGEDEWEINKLNPPTTPNYFVLGKLKKIYIKLCGGLGL